MQFRDDQLEREGDTLKETSEGYKKKVLKMWEERGKTKAEVRRKRTLK